jgi:hypothetical protein
MTTNNLDNLDNPTYTDDVVPFQFREETTKEGTLRWLKTWFDGEYEKAYGRYVMYRRYLNMYKNLDEYEADGMMKTSTRNSGAVRKKPKVRDNIVFEYTEHRVAQVSKKKTALTFIPRVQNSIDDINAAKATKLLIRGRHEETDFDGDMIRMDRTTYLLGHSAYQVDWDPSCGPYAPSYEKKKAELAEGKSKLIDEASGKEITIEEIEKSARVGEERGKLWQPYQWFIEPHKYWLKEADYANTFEWKAKQWVEKKYKLGKDTLKNSEHAKWDFASQRVEIPSNQVLVHTFWHRPTEFFPKGCKITWCDDHILEWIDWPFTFHNLPFVEEKDIEVENEYWGRPFIVNIEQFYKVQNSLLSGMARNHGMLNAPKILAPEGAVDAKSWNNDMSMVFYRGNVAPQVLQHQYVNQGELEFQGHCRDRSGKLAGIYDVSMGEPPAGVTAASAIRYLDEQEMQRATPSISKRRRRILDITRLRINIMAQNYKESDNRTVRLVGENNEFIIRSFKKLALNSIVDVREENTPAIADTKSGAIADIIDLNAVTQDNPAFTRNEIHRILDMGLDEQFKDETAYAVDAARLTLEQILHNEEVRAPETTDGLLEFYAVFGRFVESVVFREKLDEPRRNQILDYISALEMLMHQRSMKNAKFAQLLMMNDKFPMIYSPPAPPMPTLPTDGGAAAPGGPGPIQSGSGMDLKKQQIQKEMSNDTEV